LSINQKTEAFIGTNTTNMKKKLHIIYYVIQKIGHCNNLATNKTNEKNSIWIYLETEVAFKIV
jgi:hypothetical protein